MSDACISSLTPQLPAAPLQNETVAALTAVAFPALAIVPNADEFDLGLECCMVDVMLNACTHASGRWAAAHAAPPGGAWHEAWPPERPVSSTAAGRAGFFGPTAAAAKIPAWGPRPWRAARTPPCWTPPATSSHARLRAHHHGSAPDEWDLWKQRDEAPGLTRLSWAAGPISGSCWTCARSTVPS